MRRLGPSPDPPLPFPRTHPSDARSTGRVRSIRRVGRLQPRKGLLFVREDADERTRPTPDLGFNSQHGKPPGQRCRRKLPGRTVRNLRTGNVYPVSGVRASSWATGGIIHFPKVAYVNISPRRHGDTEHARRTTWAWISPSTPFPSWRRSQCASVPPCLRASVVRCCPPELAAPSFDTHKSSPAQERRGADRYM